jgi:hypothetical protein
VEREYFREMARFLREELKVKCPIVGSSDHNHYRSGYPHTAGLATLDVVDGHVYWQHPSYVRDPKGGRMGFTIPNTPMVDDPRGSTVVQLARTPVAGKPYTVSEFNHPFPNEYACEGLPILAAYAAFQDWDGIFPYTLAHADALALKTAVAGHFDYATDPVKIPQLAACALIFLRADVRPAERTQERSYAPEQVLESIRMPASERPLYTPGLPRDLPLRHAVRVSSFGGPPTGVFEGEPGGSGGPLGLGGTAGPSRSDTGELCWTAGVPRSGFVTVDAERAQALIGFCAAARTRHLSVESLSPEFCALTLGSLDARPIGRSEKLLLTAAARVANTGMRWNEKRTSLESWGTEPACIEVVTGKLILRGLEGAKGVEAAALDGAGRPVGVPIAAEPAREGWALPLGRPPATWHIIIVRR